MDDLIFYGGLVLISPLFIVSMYLLGGVLIAFGQAMIGEDKHVVWQLLAPLAVLMFAGAVMGSFSG